MKNKIIITRGFYKDITDIPHFSIQVNYEGCLIEHDDIYFGNLDEISCQLDNFEKTRKNEVIIDGGSRFKLTILPNNTGGIKLKCNSEKFNLPGRVILESYFNIDGEFVSIFINSFKELLTNGKELNI